VRGPIVSRDPDTLLISIDELGVESRIAFNFGVGTDFRIPFGPAGLGVRLELSDHIHESPLNLQVLAFEPFQDDHILNFGAVHNLRAAIGVVVQAGR
jgi:hypothetical protein